MYVKDSYLSKQLCFLLYVTSKEVIKKYTYYLKEHDLTYTSFMVVMAIEDDEKNKYKISWPTCLFRFWNSYTSLKKIREKGLC